MPRVAQSAFRCLAVSSLTLLSAALVSGQSRLASAAESGTSEESAEDAGDSEERVQKEGDTNQDGGEEAAKSDADEKNEQDASKDSLGHGGQFGLRAGVVGGLRMIVRYEESTFCREPDLDKIADAQKFCGHVAPFALDFGLSYGIVDFLEPFIWGRFGLGAEEQTDTNPIIVVGAGVRLYTMSDSAIKVFIEPAVALEFEDGGDTFPWSLATEGYGTELVFHAAAGPQFDFTRNIGLYVSGGLTAGVLRSLNASLDLQVGLQGRYP